MFLDLPGGACSLAVMHSSGISYFFQPQLRPSHLRKPRVSILSYAPRKAIVRAVQACFSIPEHLAVGDICSVLGFHAQPRNAPLGYSEPGVASRVRGESGGVSNNELITELKEVALEHVRDIYYVRLCTLQPAPSTVASVSSCLRDAFDTMQMLKNIKI